MSNNNFSVWDGSVASGFAGGTGTESAPYLISSASQLAYLSKTKPWGKHFKLTCDLDLNKIEWTPISINGAIFFDGCNHMIRGLFVNTPDKNYAGLFGRITGKSVFKNTIVEDGLVSGKMYVGGVIGAVESYDCIVENFRFSGAVSGEGIVGGIIGRGTGNLLKDCSNSGKISCTGTLSATVGGVAGEFYGEYKVEGVCDIINCINYGDVLSQNGMAGGVVGGTRGTTIVKYCTNYGSIQGKTAGGVTGRYGKIEYCNNEGNVTTLSNDQSNVQVGGIAAILDTDGYIKNSHNSGNISGCSDVGGILGSIFVGNLIELSTNRGTIYGRGSNVGGIVGNMRGTLQYCKNEGTVKGEKDYIGGIAGITTYNILHCHNTGDVSGSEINESRYVGGICGKGANFEGCMNDALVVAVNDVGGIAGFVSGYTQNCINTGSVQARNRVGGISGNCGPSTKECYNLGSACGNNWVGGITGNVKIEDAVIEKCYSAGVITSGFRAGGIIGTISCNNGQMIECHYLDGSAPNAIGVISWDRSFIYEDSPVSASDLKSMQTLLQGSHMKLIAQSTILLFWSKKKHMLLTQMSKVISISKSLGINQDETPLDEIVGINMYRVMNHTFVRESADNNSNIVSACFNNNLVKILPQNRSTQNGWYEIQVNETETGFVAMSNLTKVDSRNAYGHWVKDQISWKWQYPDGSYATYKWELINDYWYYFNSDSYMYVGWRTINDKWYYLNAGDISHIPFGAMATWSNEIYSDNYSSSFDYFFDPNNGELVDSPSEQFVAYGFDEAGRTELRNTIPIVDEFGDILTESGFEGHVYTNETVFHILESPRKDLIYTNKNRLNTGLFVYCGHSEPGAAVFYDNTALTARFYDRYAVTLEQRRLNNVKIAIFLGSESACNSPIGGNLIYQARAQGARAVLGFNGMLSLKSTKVFMPRLAKYLAAGYTLDESVEYALGGLLIFDTFHDYRIAGDATTRFIHKVIGTKRAIDYTIPKERTYELYREKDGYKTYVETINGIMTCNYYKTNPQGKIVIFQNRLPESEIQRILNLPNSTKALKMNENTDEVADIYEYFDGGTHLLHVVKTVMSEDENKWLDFNITDLETGEPIPYEKIINSD